MLQFSKGRTGIALIVVVALMVIFPSPGHAANGVVDVGTSVYRADVFVNDATGTLVNPTTATPNDTSLYNATGLPLHVSWFQWQVIVPSERENYHPPVCEHTPFRR